MNFAVVSAAALLAPSAAGLLATSAAGLRALPARCIAILSCASNPNVVLFDADGTLLDSLPPHIDFCHKMNEELGLGLTLPDRNDISACRSVAAAPMTAFFEQASFPSDVITHCVMAYESRFSNECEVLPFTGVDELLAGLRGNDVRCAIISSNTAPNVLEGLGSLSSQFEFVHGIDNAPADKSEAIAAALNRLGVEASDAIYVGDTRKDYDKASGAGVPFIGVGYGFEPLEEMSDDIGAPVALSVDELGRLLAQALGVRW